MSDTLHARVMSFCSAEWFSLLNPGTVSLVNGGFAHAANGLSDAHPVRLIIFSVGSQHLGCLLASRTKASTPTLGMRNLRRNRRPAALVSSYTSGCRMRPHHGLLAWSKRRARSSLQLKSWLKRLSLVPGASCARFLRILGPTGTPHPLCHGSASARMLSARRRHLSRRWRNVGPSSPLDESESESSQKLLMAWEDASCQTFAHQTLGAKRLVRM